MPENNEDQRLVCEVYDIDEDEIYTRTDNGNNFWDASYRFWESVKNNKYSKTTEKQKNWLLKIDRELNKEDSR